MKKIMLISDQEHLPKGLMTWASLLNDQERILLVGVFLPADNYRNNLLYATVGAPLPIAYENAVNEVAVAVDTAVSDFESYCSRNDIEYRLHPHTIAFTTDELKRETRFSDLLIFSNEVFYDYIEGSLVNEYTEYAIHHTECPVLIAPEHFQQPSKVILAYDGSPSAVFAIKQFVNTLPEFAKLDTLLVCMDDDGKELPDKEYIQELAARHFNKLTFFKANIDAHKHFADWLADRNDTLLVCGAFGRNAFSRLFRKSFIKEIIKAHKMPVFIAHK